MGRKWALQQQHQLLLLRTRIDIFTMDACERELRHVWQPIGAGLAAMLPPLGVAFKSLAAAGEEVAGGVLPLLFAQGAHSWSCFGGSDGALELSADAAAAVDRATALCTGELLAQASKQPRGEGLYDCRYRMHLQGSPPVEAYVEYLSRLLAFQGRERAREEEQRLEEASILLFPLTHSELFPLLGLDVANRRIESRRVSSSTANALHVRIPWLQETGSTSPAIVALLGLCEHLDMQLEAEDGSLFRVRVDAAELSVQYIADESGGIRGWTSWSKNGTPTVADQRTRLDWAGGSTLAVVISECSLRWSRFGSLDVFRGLRFRCKTHTEDEDGYRVAVALTEFPTLPLERLVRVVVPVELIRSCLLDTLHVDFIARESLTMQIVTTFPALGSVCVAAFKWFFAGGALLDAIHVLVGVLCSCLGADLATRKESPGKII